MVIYTKAPKIMLPKNHISFELLPDLKELCRPFFQKTGLHHFHYLHYDFNNETVVALTTAPDANSYVLENQSLATGKELEAGLHYLPLFRAGSARAEAGKRFNVDQILEWIDHKEDGTVDMFGFATLCGQAEKVNFYFNNLELLKRFTYEFKDQASGMLKQVFAQPISIPGHNKLISDLSPETNICLPVNFEQQVKLSRREYQILRAICMGHTAKKIAQLLDLSHRTVESYIANIKNKLGIQSKVELVKYSIQRHIFDDL